MQLKLIMNPSPDVEEFRDAVGIDVVIPATGIAICGIFVWRSHNADLKIYEMSLLRTNAPLYIEVIQIAVAIADHLALSGVQSLSSVRVALLNLAKTFEQADLIVK